MKVILKARGEGKTERLLAWVRAAPPGEHRVIVSADHQRAMDRLRENRDLESWQFVGVEEVGPGCWSGVLMGRGGQVVLGLDDLDEVLPRIMGWRVGAVAINMGPR